MPLLILANHIVSTTFPRLVFRIHVQCTRDMSYRSKTRRPISDRLPTPLRCMSDFLIIILMHSLQKKIISLLPDQFMLFKRDLERGGLLSTIIKQEIVANKFKENMCRPRPKYNITYSWSELMLIAQMGSTKAKSYIDINHF